MSLSPKSSIVAALLQDPAIDLARLVPSAHDGKAAMMPAFEITRDAVYTNSLLIYCGLFAERAREYRKIGRMLLAHLQFYSPQGRVAKKGLAQTGFPLDILKKIAASIDYETVDTRSKL